MLQVRFLGIATTAWPNCPRSGSLRPSVGVCGPRRVCSPHQSDERTLSGPFGRASMAQNPSNHPRAKSNIAMAVRSDTDAGRRAASRTVGQFEVERSVSSRASNLSRSGSRLPVSAVARSCPVICAMVDETVYFSNVGYDVRWNRHELGSAASRRGRRLAAGAHPPRQERRPSISPIRKEQKPVAAHSILRALLTAAARIPRSSSIGTDPVGTGEMRGSSSERSRLLSETSLTCARRIL